MISELKDDEILDFLMTSDFESDYSPTEFKFLLVKWRYFYRILQGSSQSKLLHLEGELEKFKDQIEVNNSEKILLQSRIVNNESTINSLKNRNLSWKERLSGKIILKENENQ